MLHKKVVIEMDITADDATGYANTLQCVLADVKKGVSKGSGETRTTKWEFTYKSSDLPAKAK